MFGKTTQQLLWSFQTYHITFLCRWSLPSCCVIVHIQLSIPLWWDRKLQISYWIQPGVRLFLHSCLENDFWHLIKSWGWLIFCWSIVKRVADTQSFLVILTDSPGPSLGQAGSGVGCPSPVYSTRKKGRAVPLRSDGAWQSENYEF